MVQSAKHNDGSAIPVLLDTDIGSDIDDALCLAYLLRQPRCKLIGVTTVTGEPEKRAMLASAICQAGGRSDVPIYSGTPKPLLIEQRQKHAPQAEVLPRWEHRDDFERCSAVQFLLETIRSHPGEITLLTIGPLTNIGILFALDPEVPKLLKQLVMMCGVYTTRTPGVGPLEWNAIGDPHATAIVFNAPVPKLVAVGLDVTVQCRMSAEECRNRLRGDPMLEVVADMAEVWFRRAGHITFHDPLAAVTIFEPEICTYEQGRVDVELTSPRLLGMTHWRAGAQGSPHSVAITVDSQRFFKHYFNVVSPH
ncbi:TPA: nucleoside hydrolase [Candidatus Bipolaricaulota bacterium]|nr:nucleoside hydrolase [Candidatus Bipolaricaulota bacterium]